MTLIACGGGGNNIFPTPTPTPTPTHTRKVSVAVSNTKSATLNLAMSTSFQPAEWDYQFFTNHPTQPGRWEISILRTCAYRRSRRQFHKLWRPHGTSPCSMRSFSPCSASATTALSSRSRWLRASCTCRTRSNLSTEEPFGMFGDYAANLVKYYNGPGIPNPSGGANLISPVATTYPIKYWGIHNEPNLNGFSKGSMATASGSPILPPTTSRSTTSRSSKDAGGRSEPEVRGGRTF